MLWLPILKEKKSLCEYKVLVKSVNFTDAFNKILKYAHIGALLSRILQRLHRVVQTLVNSSVAAVRVFFAMYY